MFRILVAAELEMFEIADQYNVQRPALSKQFLIEDPTMSTQRDHILEQALALPPEDRFIVADALEQSLSDDTFDSPEIAAAWAVEIERRLAEYDRGETTAISSDVVLENARKLLLEQRARKAQS
jgi:putative addiction module component (TIGR02574 family)